MTPNVRNERAPEREALREPNGDAVWALRSIAVVGQDPRITE